MDRENSYFAAPANEAQADLFTVQTSDDASLDASVDGAAEGDQQWLSEQLEQLLQRLVRTINTLVYTRNPVALAVASQQCNQLESWLNALEYSLEQTRQCVNGARAGASAIDQLLLVETHQMLAQARRLVSVPLRPVRREDNIVELQPDYGDLTDAAFERMLASSDIPQLLSAPAAWADEAEITGDSQANDSLGYKKSLGSSGSGRKHRGNLRLVYSRGRTE